MSKDSIIKELIAVLFVLALLAGFIRSGSYGKIEQIFLYLSQNEDAMDKEGVTSVDAMENEFSSSIWNHRRLIDLNGSMARRLNMQGLYSDMGMYITDDKYIVSASAYTTTDYEYEQLTAFNEFLRENGVHLLYVNEPTKYTDDSLFRDNFGVETFSNRNMDVFLDRIRGAGVNAIDLRDNIEEENINVSDLFYRTDHHWTTRAGLWASRIIAEGLNDYCGYHIDTSVYDDENYDFVNWSECWLGEQGRKVAETYVGLDDYTEIKPNFPTSYIFKSKDGNYEGTFDKFINEKVYNTEKDVYENDSWHYSYRQLGCINNKVQYGKVLILGDSFDQVTEPFISLGVHEIDSLILRKYDDSFSLRNFILENGYDTVIVSYVQFMVGAHDNPSSANYRMFTFEY